MKPQVQSSSHPSIPALLLARAGAEPMATILRRKERGIWKAIGWAELAARAQAIGRALKASGLRTGEVVGLLSDATPDWIAADLGILGAGCVSVGLYPTDGADTIAAQLRDSTARLLFVENEEQLDKALGVRQACPDLARIVVFDMKGLRDFADPACESLKQFVARAAGRPDDWAAAIAAIAADAPAVIAYTAGSAGLPQGVLLTHRNIMFQIANFTAATGQGRQDERLAFLPVCNVTERVLGLYAALHSGTVTNLVENAETVPENLREVRPTILLALPRVWEKFHAGVSVAAADATWLQRRLYAWATGAGSRHVEARLAGRGGGGLVYALARWLVLDRIRAAVGLDRIRWAGVAAAPIAAELVRWYLAVGVDIIETYGLTECTGLACMMPAQSIRPGLAGRPVPWGDLRIAEDGEILLRGEHVSPGYWRGSCTPALRQGWLHTGDLGTLEDGMLRIVGRRTDQLATAAGVTIAPAGIEASLKISPYIADALVIGDGRSSLACLVMLEADAVEAWARETNVPHTSFATLAEAPAVRELIGQQVARVNASGAGPIEAFRIIGRRLAPEDPELTQSMKLRRPFAMQTYSDLIEDMYSRA